MLRVRDLCVDLLLGDRQIPVVANLTLAIAPGRCLALVGESGSGKTLTALAIAGLLPPIARVPRGEIMLGGDDLRRLPPRELRRRRAREIGMIFQEPMTSLNPVLTIEKQIVEALPRRLSRIARRARAEELLERAGVPDPATRLRSYPHELSGGLRQRVMLAIALANDPRLLIADEPTTALDVTVQAQIIAHLDLLRRDSGLAVLFITHDLGLVERFADDVAVMYAGRIVEQAPRAQLFADPQHPYTRALLAAVPRFSVPPRAAPVSDEPTTVAHLPTIPGEPPQVTARPSGCAFHPRCAARHDDPQCADADPPLSEIAPDRHVACWHAPFPAADNTTDDTDRDSGRASENASENAGPPEHPGDTPDPPAHPDSSAGPDAPTNPSKHPAAPPAADSHPPAGA